MKIEQCARNNLHVFHQSIVRSSLETVVKDIKNSASVLTNPLGNESREFHLGLERYADVIAKKSGSTVSNVKNRISHDPVSFAAQLIIPEGKKPIDMVDDFLNSLVENTPSINSDDAEYWMLKTALLHVYNDAENIRYHMQLNDSKATKMMLLTLEEKIQEYISASIKYDHEVGALAIINNTVHEGSPYIAQTDTDLTKLKQETEKNLSLSAKVSKSDEKKLNKNEQLDTKPASTDSVISSAIIKPPIENSVSQSSEASYMKLLEEFLEDKVEEVKEKTLNDYRTKLSVILSVLDEKDISNVTFKKAKSAIKSLKDYPANSIKSKDFIGLTGLETLERNKELKKKTLSQNTIVNYLQRARMFFVWCELNGYIDKNPFAGIKVKSIANTRHPFSSSDLRVLFNTDVYNKLKFKLPYHYWLPLIGYFTGARINEICQLYKEDIVNADGTWSYNIALADDKDGKIQTLKNAFSIRKLPIHSKLIELGFIEYVNRLPKNSQLFPELTKGRDGHGATASKWFGRLKKRLGFKSNHVFHSFRHTLANKLLNLEVPHSQTAGIMGHSKGKSIELYTQSYEPRVLSKYIELIDIQGLENVKPFYND